jgi:ferric-dicitrate binding protein FerR (iron transport regulator)
MNDQDRFNQLWNDYLEGELDETGITELRELMAADPENLNGAVDDFQIHRLMGLQAQESESRHEAFVQDTMSQLPASQSDFVGQVMREVPQPIPSRVISWLPNWALSAAAAVVVMTTLWFFEGQRPATITMIATIGDMSGPALWTGDGGRVIRNLQAGTKLSGGTLEGTSPRSWVKLRFNDGSTVTLSGDSMLTFSDLGQKELHLKRGGLSADVPPQSTPMLVHTRTAMLTVLGTRFDVETELSETTLNVSEGLVGIRRISDGRSVDVPANHRVVAAADVELNPTRLPAPVHAWQSDMGGGHKRMYGKWRPEPGEHGGRLWAIPWITELDKTIYTASMPVSRSKTPVVLRSTSEISVRGRLKKGSRVFVGLTLRKPTGEFAGRFQVKKPANEFAAGEEFEIVLPLKDFQLDPSLKHVQSDLPARPDGLVIDAIWCHTLYNHVGLGVTHFGVNNGE